MIFQGIAALVISRFVWVLFTGNCKDRNITQTEGAYSVLKTVFLTLLIGGIGFLIFAWGCWYFLTPHRPSSIY